MRPLRALSLALVVLGTWLSAVAVGQALEVPPLRAHVNDEAALLTDAERAALEQKLTAHEQATGQQFALLTIPSLEDEAIEDYSMRVVETWKLGKTKKDDGLLLLIAVRDRKMRIEVGYGLEGEVPDAVASRVIRDVLTPAFRAGRFAQGIDQAFEILMARARGLEVEPPPSPEPVTRLPVRGVPVDLAFWFVVIVVVILMFSGRGGPRGRRRRGVFVPYFGPMPGGRGFGGGFGPHPGGGGGGFGGGGGRFGGGGASGGW